MKKVIFSVLLLSVFSSSSIAAEKDYKLCSLGGYFFGAEQNFLQGVASRIAEKQQMNIIDDPICAAAWKNGIDVAKHLAKSSKLRNKTDATIIQQAFKFREQVYDAVISNMNYK